MPNKPSERDADILKHIIKYCDELEEAFQVFGDSEETFVNNSVFKNAVSNVLPFGTLRREGEHLGKASGLSAMLGCIRGYLLNASPPGEVVCAFRSILLLQGSALRNPDGDKEPLVWLASSFLPQ